MKFFFRIIRSRRFAIPFKKPSGKRDEPETVDGFERQFQVNFLGHFLLTELLKDQILENNGRILNILCTSMQKATLTLDPVDKKTTFKVKQRTIMFYPK